MTELWLAIVIFVLVAGASGSIAYLLTHDKDGGLYRSRFSAIADTDIESRLERKASRDNRERARNVEKTLRDLEERNRSRGDKNKLTLTRRMRQGGLLWSKRTYYLVCLATGLTALAVLSPLIGLLEAFGLSFASAALFPYLFVQMKRKRRLKAISMEFANAVDIIVRGLSSGLLLSDCMRIIASEMKDPLRSEFRSVVHDLALGLSMNDAVKRMSGRIPLPEVGFFSIVITTQNRTGGSLSEALSNLSTVLRDRKKMVGKIKAVSSEAKSSAVIVGMMPVVVGSLVWLISPDYISLLYSTATGRLALIGCVLWMGVGVFVMKRMTSFEF